MLDNYEKVLEKFFREHKEYAGLKRLAFSYMYLDGRGHFWRRATSERLGTSWLDRYCSSRVS